MKVILITAIVALTACAAGFSTPASAASATTTPAEAPTTSTSPDTCGAGQFDDVIGKSVHTMDSVTVPPGGLRLPEGSIPDDLDNPERLNLLLDEQSNVVSAFCG